MLSFLQDLPRMVLQWPNSTWIEMFYQRLDSSEHTLTQVAALIVEGNPKLAGFQPNVSVVATWELFDKVSRYHCSCFSIVLLFSASASLVPRPSYFLFVGPGAQKYRK